MNFDWLESIIKNRTPGPWQDVRDVHMHYDVIDPRNLEIAQFITVNNAEFIAVLGTLADKILDVVKEADFLIHPYAKRRGMHDNGTSGVGNLKYALCVLQDAISEVKK